MSKIGAHVSSFPRVTIEQFCRAKPAVILGLNDSGVLKEAQDWSDGHTWTFYRTTEVYGERPPDMHDPPGTYAQMGQYWYQDAGPSLKEKYSQNQADAYLITNEAGGGEGADIRQNYKNLVAYEREIMKLANADGYKVAVLALGGGSPGDFTIWTEICVPFIKEAFDAGNWYARHAYTDNWSRVYKEAQYLLDNGLGYGPIVITEWGFNGGYGQIHDATKITDEDQALMAFPNVVGFCLWEYGKTEFNANIDHVVPQIVPYMETHQTDKWQPQDPGNGDTETWREKAWRVTAEMQIKLQGGIQLNPSAGIQERIAVDSQESNLALQVTTTETVVDGLTVQAAESLTGKVPRRVYFWNPASGAIGWFAEPTQSDVWLYPVLGREKHINHPYGEPRDYEGDGVKDDCHEGVDLLAFAGDVIIASRAGIVIWSSNQRRSGGPSNYGEHVIIDHEDGYLSWYCHMSRRDVRQGDRVEGGQRVGLAGSTGNSTAPHLHLSVEKVGYVAPTCYVLRQAIDPAPLLGLASLPAKVDLRPYVIGDGRRYYLKNQDNTAQEILQCQSEGGIHYQVKNNAWESFVIDSDWIRRDKDTSPGGGRYYMQREGSQPARWLPRHMAIGEEFTVSLRVQFYKLSDCTPSDANSGDVTDTRRLIARHNQWTSRHGVTLQDVVEVLWVNGEEKYYYARDYGLVAWERQHVDENTPQWTAISEFVQGGNNSRMDGCFS